MFASFGQMVTNASSPGEVPGMFGSGFGEGLGDGFSMRMVDNIQREAVMNQIQLHRRLVNAMFADTKRNIEQECGYPSTEELEAEDYRGLYDRDPIAARIVDLFPSECWQTCPWLYETEELNQITPFEQAWDDLGRRLAGTEFFEGQESNPIWEYLERADKLSGIGRYGVILLGFDDGKELSEPVELTPFEKLKEQAASADKPRVAALGSPEPFRTYGDPTYNLAPATDANVERALVKTGSIDKEDNKVDEDGEPAKPTYELARKLLYIRVLDETCAKVSKSETGKNDPRFGQPIEYNIVLSNADQVIQGQVAVSTSAKVHWTRVIHIPSDPLLTSEVLGTPRVQQAYNRVYDLHKLYGGSAEMYWRGAFFGISFETHPQMGGQVSIDKADAKRQVELWKQGLDRFFMLPGITAKSLAPQVVDPTPQIKAMIEAICILLAIPARIFMGSERGELASSQDLKAWDRRLKRRKNRYITPRIIVPFVSRLIMAGALPVPKQFFCQWEEGETVTETEQADIALKRIQALAAYISSGANTMMTERDFLVRVWMLSEEEADAILDNKKDQNESDEESLIAPAPTPQEQFEQELEMKSMDQQGKLEQIDAAAKARPKPPIKK